MRGEDLHFLIMSPGDRGTAVKAFAQSCQTAGGKKARAVSHKPAKDH